MIETTVAIPSKSLLCPCCGFELKYTPDNTPKAGNYYGCARCANPVQTPLRVDSAIWFERVPDESVLPLRVANKIAEMRGQLRHKGALQ